MPDSTATPARRLMRGQLRRQPPQRSGQDVGEDQIVGRPAAQPRVAEARRGDAGDPCPRARWRRRSRGPWRSPPGRCRRRRPAAARSTPPPSRARRCRRRCRRPGAPGTPPAPAGRAPPGSPAWSRGGRCRRPAPPRSPARPGAAAPGRGRGCRRRRSGRRRPGSARRGPRPPSRGPRRRATAKSGDAVQPREQRQAGGVRAAVEMAAHLPAEPSSRSCTSLARGGVGRSSSASQRARAAASPRTVVQARKSATSGGKADRAGHAGAADAAVAAGVLRQVLLVIVLGVVERRRVDDLGGDRAEAGLASAAPGRRPATPRPPPAARA